MVDRYVENLQVMEKTAPEFRDLQFIKVRLSKISLKYICLFLTMVIGQSQGRREGQGVGPRMD